MIIRREDYDDYEEGAGIKLRSGYLRYLGRLVQDKQILVEMSMTGRDMMILALVSLRHSSDDDPPVW